MIVTIATVENTTVYPINIHSPLQQCYTLQTPLQFSAFGCGWVDSDTREVNWTSRVELLIYDCDIGHCSGIFRTLTVYLRKYTQSMAAILSGTNGSESRLKLATNLRCQRGKRRK